MNIDRANGWLFGGKIQHFQLVVLRQKALTFGLQGVSAWWKGALLVNLFWESYDGSLSPLSLDLNVNAHFSLGF